MSQARERTLEADPREQRVAAADCRGRGCRAGAGWGGERGSWVSGAEALGNAPTHRMRGACALAPGGPLKTWLPSGGGG